MCSFVCHSKTCWASSCCTRVHKSFTLHNGLFAKAPCYFRTREAKSPKCLILCSLAICHCFTASIACVITPPVHWALSIMRSITRSEWKARHLWGWLFSTGVTPNMMVRWYNQLRGVLFGYCRWKTSYSFIHFSRNGATKSFFWWKTPAINHQILAFFLNKILVKNSLLR